MIDPLHIAIISDESIKPLVIADTSKLPQKIAKSSTKVSEVCHANRDISKSYDVESNKKLPRSDTKRPIEKDPEIKSDILKPSIVSTISR